MAFDGIVTKAIASELHQLSGARIDKVFQPDKNIIILGFYTNGKNYALNICTTSQNYRLHLTTHSKPNPKIAPNFCMLLRKHLIGLHIKNVITTNLERVITIEFEGFDDIDDIITKKMVIELMGKHCNIILLDDRNMIIDSLRHINNYEKEESSRMLVPHSKYIYPITNKYNFLECINSSDFINKLPSNLDMKNIAKHISNTFNGISKSFIQEYLNRYNISSLNNNTLKNIYEFICQIISNTDSLNLTFENILDENNNIKDYFLNIPNTNNINNNYNNLNFSLNFFIDDFYYSKETSEDFKAHYNNTMKKLSDISKKYIKRLDNIQNKLESCKNMQTYQLYGKLITANIYRIPNKNTDNIILENYYDNNKEIKIPLDNKFSPANNAKKYFKKYNKLKNALEIVSIQKEETLKELNYIESIIYELENCISIKEISQIIEEVSENIIFKEKLNNNKSQITSNKSKKSNNTKNKEISFNPIKYIIDGFTLLVGRNNKENDYLTLKYANKTDLWFHTKDIHGSHAILLLENKKPTQDTLVKCAQITAYHSRAKSSSNVPVDMCNVKYVKKPNNAKPGMVIYTNNQTLYVTPQKIEK